MSNEIIIGILTATIIVALFLIGRITNLATEATELAKQDREKLTEQQAVATHLREELEATNDLLQTYREENKRMLDLALRLSQPNTMVDAHRDRASYYVALQGCAQRLEQAEQAYHDAVGQGEFDKWFNEQTKVTALDT